MRKAASVDRRSVRIGLTAKGREVYEIVEVLCQKHARTVEQVGRLRDECRNEHLFAI